MYGLPVGNALQPSANSGLRDSLNPAARLPCTPAAASTWPVLSDAA